MSYLLAHRCLRSGLGLVLLSVLLASPAGGFKPWADFGHKGIVENALLGGTWNGRTYPPLTVLSSIWVTRFSTTSADAPG